MNDAPHIGPSWGGDRPPVLTLFATLKPFRGQAAVQQRNAILSWTLLRPRPEVILFGDEEGVPEICRELGLRHVPEVARNEFGTPLISDLFGQAQDLARAECLCYANGDIILTDDLMEAVGAVRDWRGRGHFLATGQRLNVPVDGPLDPDGPWEQALLKAAGRSTSTGGGFALDYFVLTRGLYRDIPPFAVARPGWDTWMVYGARVRGAPVIDLSRSVRAIHQAHDAPRRPPGPGWSYPVETRRNLELSASAVSDIPGGSFGLADATHVLTARGVVPAWRTKGPWRYVQRELKRLPARHPSLDRPIRAARRGGARVRSALLRSPLADLARATGRRVIHCFGDTQALVFGTIRSKELLPRTWIDLTWEPSLRAGGLNGAGGDGDGSVRGVIDRLPKGRTLVFLVGAVDCGSDGSVAEAFERYSSFLQGLLEEGRSVVAVAVPPPTSRDGDGGADPSLRREMELTKQFNALLRQWAADGRCPFLDYESDVLDPDTGLVRDEFQLQEQREINLDPGPWSEVLASHLRAMGFS